MQERLIDENDFEKVILQDDHYYVINNKELVAIIPYTIKDGILEQIGIINVVNEETEEEEQTLIMGYLKKDDVTNLDGANRILKDTIYLDITDAEKWIYLGELSMNQFSKSSFKIYGVDITNKEVKYTDLSKFELVELPKVTQSNDLLFLSSYLRLFNYFYVKSIKVKN